MLKYALPYKKTLVVAFITSVLFVITNISSLWLIGSFTKFLFPKEAPTSTVANLTEMATSSTDSNINDTIKNWISGFLSSGNQIETLGKLCILIFVMFLLKNIFFYLRGISFGYVSSRAITDLRNEAYTHLNNLSMSFFDKKQPGEIASILIFDVRNIRATLGLSFNQLLVEPFNIFAILIVLFIIDWQLTLVSVLIIPVSGYIMQTIGKSIRRKSVRSSKQMAGISSMINETVHGIRIVKAFAMEKFELEKFHRITLKFFKLLYRRVKIRRLSTPINETFAVGIGVLLLYFGGKSVITGQGMTAEDFLRYVVLIFAMLDPIRKLNRVNIKIQQGIAAASRVFSVLDEKIEVKEPENPKTITEFNNEIKYENLSFKYETSLDTVLNNINLTVNKGEIFAFVGHSGAGKTTLVDLLPRFYDPISGQITIDNQNINEFSLKSLRRMMGIVTQDTILFNDSIRNNIAYGIDKIDEEKLIQATEAANALEFINELPEKFETNIGDNGSRLSGGQRQRLAIARAIFKNQPILILDEATSSLDSESEAKVQQAIEHLMKNRTSFVIAHRLSTIQNADKIVVMDGGKIAEIGTHKELLDKNGAYKKLYDTQFAE